MSNRNVHTNELQVRSNFLLYVTHFENKTQLMSSIINININGNTITNEYIMYKSDQHYISPKRFTEILNSSNNNNNSDDDRDFDMPRFWHSYGKESYFDPMTFDERMELGMYLISHLKQQGNVENEPWLIEHIGDFLKFLTMASIKYIGGDDFRDREIRQITKEQVEKCYVYFDAGCTPILKEFLDALLCGEKKKIPAGLQKLLQENVKTAWKDHDPQYVCRLYHLYKSLLFFYGYKIK